MALELSLLSETEFETRVPENFPVSCPTLDLTVTWGSGARNVLIYRPPGQAVSKIHQLGPPGSKALDALAVTWKHDGQFLAVGWSDGIVRLMGLENNKAAHHIEVCRNSDAKITHIGWASSNISSRSLQLASSHLAAELSREYDTGDDMVPSNLPQELIFLEVETALPKLSPLPSGSAGSGEDAMVFTLRTGIDFLFQAPKLEEYDRVNIMIIGISNGQLHLSINDSFVIGTFKYPTSIASSATKLLTHHFSSPLISTHSLLVAEKSKQPEGIHLLPMDLPFISSLPINVALLASKLTTLQKLLRYLKQTQLHMCVEWKNTRELPTRFLRSIQEDLEGMKSGPRNIVAALYHTVVTGHAYDPVREWLIESLAERGHKRWDKAVVSGLENLRSLVHENFLPALDRCSIILSRLRGLAQFYDSREDIGFSVTQITKIMDIVACLNLVGHKILLLVMEELDFFGSFSTWLRGQIDRLASSGSEGEELTEKDATMDHGKVLSYIERYLVDSPVKVYFDDMSQEDRDADLKSAEDGRGLLDVLTAQLKKHEKGQDTMKALPRVEFLVDYASSCSSRLFESIAEAKRRSVRFGKPLRLSIGQPVDLIDGRMCATSNKRASTYIALASKGSGRLCLFHAGLDIVNGISDNLPPTACSIGIGNRKLIDLKFLDDSHLVLLCTDSPSTTPVFILVPFHAGILDYGPYDPSSPDNMPVIAVNDFDMYHIPEDKVMKPVQMEVHDSTDLRGHVPKRICLLGANRTTLRSFTFPG